MRFPRMRWIIAAVVAVAAVSLFFVLRSSDRTQITVQFKQVQGVYVGDNVTMLGVPIGRVSSITPEADHVEVRLSVDAKVPLPADVKAAVYAPALVTVRSIALGPAYDGGPRLESGATIPESRTVIPVEWDEVKTQLTRLSTALGPNGANRNGAVSDLLGASSTFLKGSGGTINSTLVDLSKALDTISQNRGNLFSTLNNLEVFVSALKGSDQQVQLFNARLASVSSALDGDHHALGDALSSLHTAFGQVNQFLASNQNITVQTLHDLRSTTSILEKNRQRLADFLQVAPTTLSDFYNVLDARNGSQTGVLAATNLDSPAQVICAALIDLGGPADACKAALGPVAQYLQLNSPPTSVIPPLGPQSSSSGRTSAPTQSVVPSLSQLLGGL